MREIRAQIGNEVVEVEGPAFAESITEGDIRWLKQKGDFVNSDELVAEIETDKVGSFPPFIPLNSLDFFRLPSRSRRRSPAPSSSCWSADGEKVGAKQKLYKLQKGEGGGGGKQAKSGDELKPPETQHEKPNEEKQEVEKPALKPTDKPGDKSGDKSSEKPQQSSGYGDRGANAPKTKDDKSHAGPIPSSLPQVPKPPSKPMSSQPTSEISTSTSGLRAPADGKNPITGDRTETRVKMNRMRQRIAQRLKEAQNVNAMLTTFNEVDMSNIMGLRKKYQEAFVKKHGIKLGLMSPFIRAAALALQDQPVVNAVIEGEEMVYRNYVDISVAVATPKGLVVPVIRNVEAMGYSGIEKTLAELGAKARDGKIAIEDMQGGTFTISNGGVFGSLYGTPIINPPQSAILGMHSIVERPVAVNGEVKIRPMMYLALTYDHRLIDGREAVLFLRKIKEGVEDPATILLDL
ncbi:hypothetical protein M3Y99_01086400 [Aphelenchoides fujianensis]|nr:hypothetical protein M3Y99_01086400 [Aphelenchoides fujianensis]